MLTVVNVEALPNISALLAKGFIKLMLSYEQVGTNPFLPLTPQYHNGNIETLTLRSKNLNSLNKQKPTFSFLILINIFKPLI